MGLMRPLAAIALSAAFVVTFATPGGAAVPPSTTVENGMTQPVFSLDDAVRETVFVESSIDSDGDGKRDRIHAEIKRPNTAGKVPVIYETSPYRSGGNDVPNHDVDIPELPPPPGQQRDLGEMNIRTAADWFDGTYYDDQFVPRGYAVVLAESIGSGESGGCPTTGDRNETLGATAVIDWLNGRAKAFDREGNEITAGWSTGATGMIGTSYNGTLPNAAASTGVEGLKTIVPIAAISDWYDYYRANGLVVAPGGYQGEDADVLAKYVHTNGVDACNAQFDEMTKDQDRLTGDRTRFWRDRSYMEDVKKVRASVFTVHGLNDWNVKTKQVAQWWNALAKRDVPRKMWLHQEGHASPYRLRQEEWLRQLTLWMDYWLYGIDNGIMKEPRVDIQRENRAWSTAKDWPAPGTEITPVYPRAASGDGAGELATEPGGPRSEEGIVDDASLLAADLAGAPEVAHPNRLAYLSPELTEDVRISGTGKITVAAAVENKPAANLTALLVDYGEAERIDYNAGIGKSRVTPLEIVTRGWMDPNNRLTAERSDPIKQGKEYKFRFDFQADDYVFPAGHRIGLVLISSDNEYTQRPDPGTAITVMPAGSRLDLPVLGRLPF